MPLQSVLCGCLNLSLLDLVLLQNPRKQQLEVGSSAKCLSRHVPESTSMELLSKSTVIKKANAWTLDSWFIAAFSNSVFDLRPFFPADFHPCRPRSIIRPIWRLTDSSYFSTSFLVWWRCVMRKTTPHLAGVPHQTPPLDQLQPLPVACEWFTASNEYHTFCTRCPWELNLNAPIAVLHGRRNANN